MTLSVQIAHRFDTARIDVGFDAPMGLTALFGRSGSGKTTVINAVAGLLRPDQGRIAVSGQVLVDTSSGINVPPHRRGLGYVFQDHRLFPHLTVQLNLTYGRWFSRRPPMDMARVVEMLGIGPLLQRRPAGLSGGEKARVAIGRALLCNPSLLLMDEPFAALDEARKAEILPFVERLRDEVGIPILYVSHAMAEVARLATTLVVMEAGRVVAAGPAARLMADPDLAPRLGVREAGAMLLARVAAQDADGLTRLETSAGPLWLPRVQAPVGAEVRVRIAAQDVMLATTRPDQISALNILPATVTTLRMGEGPGALVQIEAGGALLLARITRRSAEAMGLAPGGQVFAILKSVAVAPQDVGRQQTGG